MKYLLITNCTNRKSLPPSNGLDRYPKLIHETKLVELTRDWVKKIENATSKIQAKDLYKGRTISDIKKTTQLLRNADVSVISAGLGLVNFEELIPSYELSVSNQSDFIKNLNSNNINIDQWWSTINKIRLNKINPLSDLINSGDYSKIFISTSASYLDLITTDLLKCSPKELKKVLIFTSPLGQKKIELNQVLKSQIIPYDERFEDKKSGYSGTRVDFPQRTLRHFVEILNLENKPTTLSQQKVLTFLSNLKKPTLPSRLRLSDEEIKKIIKINWDANFGLSHKLLKHIRHVELVACEQSRFKKLWHDVNNGR